MLPVMSSFWGFPFTFRRNLDDIFYSFRYIAISFPCSRIRPHYTDMLAVLDRPDASPLQPMGVECSRPRPGAYTSHCHTAVPDTL